ncbi:MAG: hypothetical protein NZM11_01870 [Anaerolineales bacterium]|nr:hypothetical protein [Anaerolineales bacterium]
MRKLALKENRIAYDAGLEQALREGEAVILEREGRAVAAVLPWEEYEAFRAWKAAQQTVPGMLWREDRTLEEVIADIRRRGPGVSNMRPATASLAELLQNSPHNADFDLEEWSREWAKIEAEIEANDTCRL